MRPAVVRGVYPQRGNGRGLRRRHCSTDQCLCSLVTRVKEHHASNMLLPSRIYSQGRVIYEQGEPATHIYWLCEGEVELVRYTPSGRIRILRLLRSGELFGLEALAGVEAYRQCAYTRRTSYLLAMDPQELRDLLQDPQGSSLIVQATAHAVVTAEERLDALLSPEILRRVAQTLWQWIQPYADTDGSGVEGEAEAGGVAGVRMLPASR